MMYPQDPQDPRSWQTPYLDPPAPRRPASSKTAMLVVAGGSALLFAAGMATVFILVGSGSPVAQPVVPVPTLAPRVAAPETTAGDSPPAAAVASQPAETSPPAEQSHEPKVLLRDSGSGSKNTAQFTVDDSWQVHYTYDCSATVANAGYMSSWLKAGTDSVDLLVNETGAKNDKTTPQYRAGTFHLEITASCPWTIEVADI